MNCVFPSRAVGNWAVRFTVRCSDALAGPGALGSVGRGSRAPRPASGCRGLLVLVSLGPIAI